MNKEEKIFYKLAIGKNYITKSRALDAAKNLENAPDGSLIKIIKENAYMTDDEIVCCLELIEKRMIQDGKEKELRQREKETIDILLDKGLISEDIVKKSLQIQEQLSPDEFVTVGLILLKNQEICILDYINSLNSENNRIQEKEESSEKDEDKVILICSSCGRKHKVSVSVAGRRLRCKRCQSPLAENETEIKETSGGRSPDSDDISKKQVDGKKADSEDITKTREENSTEIAKTREENKGKRNRLKVDSHHRIDGDVDLVPDHDIVEFGNYEILGEIARGAMGIIYKSRQKNLNRIVALKVLRDGHKASKGAIMRFQREAEAAGCLTHPNIVAIHEWGSVDGVPYFSMDYIVGTSLDVMIRKGALSQVRSLEIMEEIARAVHFAHINGVVHRDLKPANIIIDKHGVPKITDFGLAKTSDFHGKLTQSGYAIGTPFYMSPEQARGDLKRIGPKSDIYNLGVILYELLTRRIPFTGKTNVEIYEKIENQEPAPPSLYNRKISRDLDTICLKAMEKDSRLRYRSALEFAEDVRRYLDGDPIIARPIGPLGKLLKMAKKYRVTLFISLMVLLVSLSVFTFLLLYLKSGSPHPFKQESTIVPSKVLLNAQQKMRAGDFAHALRIIDPCLLEAKTGKILMTGEILLYHGIICYYNGKYIEAVVDLNQILENPENPILSKLSPEDLAKAYLFKGASYIKSGQIDDALKNLLMGEKVCKKILKDNDHILAKILYYNGLAYANIQNYGESLKSCTKSIEIYPKYFIAFISQILLEIGLASRSSPPRLIPVDSIKSIAHTAQNLVPSSPLPYQWMAYIYIQNKEYKEALNEYINFLRNSNHIYFSSEDTSQKQEHNLNGIIYPVYGLPELRQENFSQIIPSLDYFQDIEISEKNREKIVEKIREIINIWENTIQNNSCVCIHMYFKKNYTQLSQSIERLEIEYNMIRPYIKLFDKVGKPNESIGDLKEGFVKSEQNCQNFILYAQFFQSVALCHQGNYSGALSQINKSIKFIQDYIKDSKSEIYFYVCILQNCVKYLNNEITEDKLIYNLKDILLETQNGPGNVKFHIKCIMGYLLMLKSMKAFTVHF